jgi:hypothetical protein
MQLVGGTMVGIERSGSRTRYTLSAPVEQAQVDESGARLKAALQDISPNQQIYLDWVRHVAPAPGERPEGYPFRVERDASDLPRHKMNLIFATCGQADALIERGDTAEARRLLLDAALLEPEAGFVLERIQGLP